MSTRKIVVTGAAGLVGQNLIPRLKRNPAHELVAIDKHPANVAILRRLHPELRVVEADLAEPGAWQQELEGCTHLMIGHAQIGGLFPEEFVRNNITASERLIETALHYKVGYAVNISSSVVNSMAVDDYTETKKAQEAINLASGIKQVVLRPTLMFGWFDRKHVGWLAQVLAVAGDGKHRHTLHKARQPMYVGDFCDIIAASLQGEITGAYNITGQQRVDYIDLMKMVKAATGAKTPIITVPYGLFSAMLKAYALVDKNPAFTDKQLQALVTPDIFEVIDWPAIFEVRSTPLQEALNETFRDPTYSGVVLEF
jgi:uncharacterized protein YbjT (DUF2867 family)